MFYIRITWKQVKKNKAVLPSSDLRCLNPVSFGAASSSSSHARSCAPAGIWFHRPSRSAHACVHRPVVSGWLLAPIHDRPSPWLELDWERRHPRATEFTTVGRTYQYQTSAAAPLRLHAGSSVPPSCVWLAMPWHVTGLCCCVVATHDVHVCMPAAVQLRPWGHDDMLCSGWWIKGRFYFQWWGHEACSGAMQGGRVLQARQLRHGKFPDDCMCMPCLLPAVGNSVCMHGPSISYRSTLRAYGLNLNCFPSLDGSIKSSNSTTVLSERNHQHRKASFRHQQMHGFRLSVITTGRG